jgi:hypothetical protein
LNRLDREGRLLRRGIRLLGGQVWLPLLLLLRLWLLMQLVDSCKSTSEMYLCRKGYLIILFEVVGVIVLLIDVEDDGDGGKSHSIVHALE